MFLQFSARLCTETNKFVICCLVSRSTASGLLMSVGRMAAILGNLSFGELVDVYCLVPMFLVAGLLNAGGLLSLKLPNTAHVDID